MKLVITGASGYVATEVIRQSLNPEITSVIVIARRSVAAPSNLDSTDDVFKLHSVVVNDCDSILEDVMEELANVDTCIWTVAITSRQAKGIDINDVRRVCHDYAITGLEAIFKAYGERGGHGGQPPRFMYMSGVAAERDHTKTTRCEAKLQGETENSVLAFAAEHKGSVDLIVAKASDILAQKEYLQKKDAATWPIVSNGDVSAAMLHGIIHGMEKQTLKNKDLVRIGGRAAKVSK